MKRDSKYEKSRKLKAYLGEPGKGDLGKAPVNRPTGLEWKREMRVRPRGSDVPSAWHLFSCLDEEALGSPAVVRATATHSLSWRPESSPRPALAD